ncbi:MAG: SsrA-binding protein SmpB [Candidatus Omnitrophota bacterium]|jgi:SsrA-binding protein|nr:MAG: SsrA-binding protein SmpB [Candidatus Omnitrophota bacterium]
MKKILASNRQAQRDYEVLETLECGIELKGSEVKSVRAGKVNLKESFACVERNEVVLYNTHISPYEQASYLNVEPTRVRKLLLHKNQIIRLIGKVAQKGFTLIPLDMYFSDRGLVKVTLALCKGKKLFDRRDDIRRREADLSIRRALKDRRRNS